MLEVCIFLSEDTSVTNERFQYQSLLRFLRLDDFDNPVGELRQKFLLNNGFEYDNFCEWNGITCVQNNVQRVVLHVQGSLKCVKCDWIPSSTEVVHLSQLYVLPDMDTSRLPRELAYLHYDYCFNVHSLQIHRLPEKMEELVILGGCLRGTLDVTNLPPQMRAIVFTNVNFDKVFVINSKLPSTLEFIEIQYTDKVCRIKTPSGEKPDKRVTLSRSAVHTKSEVFLECREIISEARRRIENRSATNDR